MNIYIPVWLLFILVPILFICVVDIILGIILYTKLGGRELLRMIKNRI